MTLNGTEVIRNAASHERYSIRHTSFRSRELNITDKREINTSFLPERKGKFSLRASVRCRQQVVVLTVAHRRIAEFAKHDATDLATDASYSPIVP